MEASISYLLQRFAPFHLTQVLGFVKPSAGCKLLIAFLRYNGWRQKTMTLSPLETLFDTDSGITLPMPAELAMLYGKLQFPPHPGQPYVISNFVESLDGVVSLNTPGHSGSGEISGYNQQDRMLMGILRAASDAVVVGAGTLRADAQHIWTAEHIFPELADSYQSFRSMQGKSSPPLNVIVTSSGEVDLRLPVFASGEVVTLIITNESGRGKLEKQSLPPSVQVHAASIESRLSGRAILETINRGHTANTILVEGGPQLLGDFLAEELVDELFLTLAPQIVGQDESNRRPALVEGQVLAPERAIWSKLISVKRGGDHLFLRYAL
jgi:riboflavin biosynthesis pyrimidine reductase